MAKKIEAISRYRPRIKRGVTWDRDMVAQFVADLSSLNRGEIFSVFYYIHDITLMCARGGSGFELPGLGTFILETNRKGEIRLVYLMDRELKNKLQNPELTREVLQNRKHIDKSDAEYIAMWDAEFPDNPVVDR